MRHLITALIATHIVAATLLAGLWYGLHLKEAVNARAALVMQKECPDTLKTYFGIDDKPTVCR